MSAIICLMTPFDSGHKQQSDAAFSETVLKLDEPGWADFLTSYGGLLLPAVAETCETQCRVSRRGYACVLHTLASQALEPVESPDACHEAIALFRWTVAQLRRRLPESLGHEDLSGWLTLTLQEIKTTYYQEAWGRISLLAGLENASDAAKMVFRLSCRVSERSLALSQSGLGEEEFSQGEEEVKRSLDRAGLTWWPWKNEGIAVRVQSHISAAAGPPAKVPAWLLRRALDTDEQEAPDTLSSHRSIRQRLLAHPDWLAGAIIGGVVCVFVLLIVLPRQEYASPVKSPEDEVLSVAAFPLTADQGLKLGQAREDLRRGKIESALNNLNRIIAARPDEQETRWLLASTYDRLGDQTKALKHYRVYLRVHDARKNFSDSRAQRARERLAIWDGD